jgi:aspartyl-tRNA(Asn)/glutamyl-tRNA(Gln) amidotransferase subunit C
MSMSKLTREEIVKLGKLAKLEISENEIELYSDQLTKVLDHINELQKVDTANIGKTLRVVEKRNMLREDKVEKDNCLSQNAALSGTKSKYNGYFVVPMVLGEKTL